MGVIGRTAGNLAKKAGNAAVSKAKHKANGGCPGSDDGKHRYKAERIEGTSVSYCRNKGCGRVH